MHTLYSRTCASWSDCGQRAGDGDGSIRVGVTEGVGVAVGVGVIVRVGVILGVGVKDCVGVDVDVFPHHAVKPCFNCGMALQVPAGAEP